jgi:putative transposase
MVPEMSNGRRRRSVRLPAYDYRTAGAYFVTLVEADRAFPFGDVADDVVRLTAIGRIVEEEWFRTADIRDSVELDEFVVMPNHLHGVLWILDKPGSPIAGTPPRAPTGRKFGQPVSRSLSTIINNFKGRVTRRVRELRVIADQTVWQRGYYERIIRNDVELLRVREYIVGNPRLWAEDEENPARTR